MNCPVEIVASLDRYVLHRIRTGGFLEAVLSNDLFDAMRRGDAANLARLEDICVWIANHMPPQCYGSREAVAAWLKGGDS